MKQNPMGWCMSKISSRIPGLICWHDTAQQRGIHKTETASLLKESKGEIWVWIECESIQICDYKLGVAPKKTFHGLQFLNLFIHKSL